MTSLTPNQDAVRKLGPKLETREAQAKPGVDGLFAWLNIELMTALVNAQAREVVRGAEAAELISCCATVVGQMVASLGASANRDDVLTGAQQVLRVVITSAAATAAEIQAGMHDHTMLEAIDAGHRA